MSKSWPFIPVLGAIIILLFAGGQGFAQVEAVAAADSVSDVHSVSVTDSTTLATAALDTLPEGIAEAIAALEIDMWDSGVSPAGAVLMTPLLPGWGQLYADNSWRGALSFGVEMYYWTNLVVRDLRATRYRRFAEVFPTDHHNYDYYNVMAEENWEQMRDFAWWSGGILLIIALDAYVGAHLFHFDEDPLPVPNQWDEHFEPLGYDMPGGAVSPSLVVFQWRKTF